MNQRAKGRLAASATEALLGEDKPPREPQLSVVMPCLNEAETVATCVTKALHAMRGAGIDGEVIVADNGSTDGSQDLAASLGARVITVPDKGYGSALMGGIAAARSRFVLMGDADDSYDFLEIPKFYQALLAGADLVQGCRLPAGGGVVKPGAMPFSHRWVGNPMFSWMAQSWFHAPIHDVYCGMRAFTKEHYAGLQQRCVGMEFATEMIIKSSLRRATIIEVPITLHRDGRSAHPPHLKTVRDGWRTLRFFLVYSPRWLFLLPGFILSLLGVLGYALVFTGARWGRLQFEAHTLLFASMALICGYQSILFAVFTKIFAANEHLLPPDPRMDQVSRWIDLERGILAGVSFLVVGSLFLLWAVNEWRQAGFGRLPYPHLLFIVIPGSTLNVIGFQTVLSSFFASILGIKRR